MAEQTAKRQRKSPRLWVQGGFTMLSNAYLPGFVQGGVYQGTLKRYCLPGLNCYSCPGALGSCPIGSLQAVLSSRNFSFSFYVTGFLLLFGAALGRFVCGWLCPFGLFEDLLYKIPGFQKRRRLPGDRFLQWLKYLILLVFVILLPLFVVDFVGQGKPWFCSYICPSGTLMGGIPLFLLNRGIRDAAGWLYLYKMGILIGLIVLSIIVYRPFCRYLCPLGAIYGLFNPIALTRYRVDAHTCVKCGACAKVCGMEVAMPAKVNHPNCIHCGACQRHCPTGAISRANAPCRAKKEATA